MYGKENILIIAVLAVILTIASLNRIECHEDGLDEHEHEHAHKSSDVEQDDATAPSEIDENEIEYQKGSVCGYCEYCKFCKLCDKDCPCEKGPGKPNCHMCKYCKYCYLCTILCDTVCQPGGIIDRVSSSIFSKLPKFNQEEVDNDIDGVQDWIEKTKDEL